MPRNLTLILAVVVLFAFSAGAVSVRACPVGDMTGNCKVDGHDLRLFVQQWLNPGGSADFDDANGVNMDDFAVLAEDWQIDYGSTMPLVINEFMASNDSFVQDPCGNYDDWIEIYNYGEANIDIGGIYVTDDACNPKKWQVPVGDPPETTIAAKGYLLIWADDQTFQGLLHTSFKLSAGGGEDVALFEADGNTPIDSVTNFPAQEVDNSYGRFPNGIGSWTVFIHDTNSPPTPGASNGGEPNDKQVLINELMYHPYHDILSGQAEDIGEEYIELYNGSNFAVNLKDWRFTDGVDFTFPSVVIGSGGYLVVAANEPVFSAKYPSVTNVVGGWTGKLSNSGEAIELINEKGVRIDYVRYADEGDWSVRELGPLDDDGHNGWVWSDAHDGDGNSLELMNPALSNEYGQNWSASVGGGEGTPGVQNSVHDSDIAPMILDVEHLPVIGQSSDAVTVTAHIIDELTSGITVTLHYRVDGSTDFNEPAMLDDGAHGDGVAGDGVYGASIPAHANDTIIEFYVEANDSGASWRTWPGPTQPSGQQLTNALYQVDDRYEADVEWVPGSRPVYYIVMTDAERYELLVEIGNGGPDKYSNAQMNATFISADGVDIKTRYNVGVRNRGKGSRLGPPMNYRVNFVNDRSWKGVTAININSRVAHSQLLGGVIDQLAGLAAADCTVVQTRVNGLNRTDAANPYFDTYAHVEVIDGDFADKHFPRDDAGNVYRVTSVDKNADLSYLGTNPTSYTARGYQKETNSAENDWSDLVNLTDVLSNTSDASYVEEVKKVVNVKQWLRWFAVQSLFSNTETNLGNGYGDDYYMYCGVIDPRFVLVPYDVDNILSLYDIPDTWSDPGVYNASIWLGEAANTSSNINSLPIIERFLLHPAFVGRYLAYLKEELKTTFSAEKINPMLDHALGGFIPQSIINDVKQFVADRSAYVLTQIPQEFTINSDLAVTKGYHKTTSSGLTELKAIFAAKDSEPLSVRVNGQLSDWQRISSRWWDGDDEWTISTSVTLNPGINRMIVQTFDDANGTGNEVECGYIDIWYDAAGSAVPNPLTDPNTVLDAASGPWYVSSNLTVPAGKILKIAPGTTVFFARGKTLTVNGRLVAQGSEYQRIRFALDPEAGGSPSQHWNGINFASTLEDSRLCYVDMDFADNDSEAINISSSRLLIDNTTWLNTTNLILEVSHPSLKVSNSVFPNTSGVEIIHGSSLSGSECFILKGNTLGTTTGYNDIIDFSGCSRPGPILEVYNNVFLGGEDDALDLDGTDAHIEGNIFMNFKGGVSSTSNAIATDLSSEIVAVRNIFMDNDRAVLLKGYASIQAEHNVFVRSSVSAINFQESGGVDPGESAWLEGNIFWDNNSLFENEFGADPCIVVNRCIISSELHGLGVDNLDVDPLFVDADGNDFHLQSISPAIGGGINGLDTGAYVAGGASTSGEPNGTIYQTDVNLTVDGPGITHYKYRVNDGALSGEISVDAAIELSGLVDGNSYTVYVSGKNSAGAWQSEPNFNASKTWTIDTSYNQLVINEVLAQNVEAVDHSGTTPDIIELYYDGPSSMSLSDMSITDNPDNPRKYVFGGGTTIDPGEYLVLYADDNFLTPGIHLDFGLNADGEGVYLYDTVANGGGLIDSVEFGQQLADLSIGRIADGQWRLNVPTLGGANAAHILGNPATLKINEWLAEGDYYRATDFIEIYNRHSMPVDMGGMFVSDNPASEPNRHEIASLSFVDGAGYATFIADGDPEDGAHHVDFRLSCDGEIIGLFDASLNEVDQVAFFPQTTDVSEGLWPDGNDGYEFLLPPTKDVSNITTVVINEVMAHSHGVAPDWIELYNTTDANIDIGGWFLSDNSGNRKKYEIADGTTLDANDYIVFYENTDFNDPCDTGCLAGFGLSENGEMVCLSSGADGVLTGYYKSQEFGASSTGVPFGRHLKSTGIYDFVSLDTNTPGNANGYPKVGPVVVNEIMYHPEPNGAAEYIELYNITGADVNLHDGLGSGWKFTEGVEFTFPVDVNIPAHGYLLVVQNLSAFGAEYPGVPGSVRILEWDLGQLDNAGEQIEIGKPGEMDAWGQREYIVVEGVHFDDRSPWPAEPDGYGYSLTRTDPNLYGNDPNNWEGALPSPGL